MDKIKPKLCSIIIRTKNEERWISSCLMEVFNQTYKFFEVIIVDNESTDRTLEKVKKFPVKKVVSVKKYLPGDSLNTGIRASSGEYIVCLSGHCIPVNEFWLEKLVKALEENKKYAGVYGRQEPMAFSTPHDKRDLLLVFGLDKRVQVKDSFFHNANSILKRSLWDEVPFDSEVTNIEDRIWGQEMIEMNYNLCYEPEASVYHYHGIHQDGNIGRCKKIVQIIEKRLSNPKKVLNANNFYVIAIVPVRGGDSNIGNQPQIYYTIKSAKESKYINHVFVTTDDEHTASLAIELGAECPFIRSKSLTNEYVGLEVVFQDALNSLEKDGMIIDLVVLLEETFPFREFGMIDNMIDNVIHGGYDTVIAAKYEPGSIWREKSGSYSRIDSGNAPRIFKEKSFIGFDGLCCVTHPDIIRQGEIFGKNVGLFEVKNPLSFIEVRDNTSRKLIEGFIDKY